MTKEISKDHVIKTTGDPGVYEGLRSLWCEVFGDGPEYVDFTYENFGGDIKGYAAVDEAGRVCSALTIYKAGSYEGRPVSVIYAVCTAPDCRGLGLASVLTQRVREEVAGEGGISIVSPSEPSLEAFYAELGYEPWAYASERAVMSPDLDMDDMDDFEDFEDFDEYDLDFGEEEFEAVTPALDMKRIDAATYGRYREAFLAGRPHVELSPDMLRLIEADSMDGSSLYSINNGDAVCAVSEAGPAGVVLTELLVSPVLLEISGDIEPEIASMIAKRFDAAETVYRTPGPGRCQTMAYGIEAAVNRSEGTEAAGEEYFYEEAYYGFPIE